MATLSPLSVITFPQEETKSVEFSCALYILNLELKCVEIQWREFFRTYTIDFMTNNDKQSVIELYNKASEV